MTLIINTAITTIVGTIIGMLISKLKSIREEAKKAKEEAERVKEKNEERDKLQNQALMILLQSNLTNTYFVYSNLKRIPEYIYKNWLNELKVYEELGGDEYVHILANNISKFEIIKEEK